MWCLRRSAEAGRRPRCCGQGTPAIALPIVVPAPAMHCTAHTAGAHPGAPPCTAPLQGLGAVVEFEGMTLAGDLPASLYGPDNGQGAVRELLLLPPMVQLSGMPANFSVQAPNGEPAPSNRKGGACFGCCGGLASGAARLVRAARGVTHPQAHTCAARTLTLAPAPLAHTAAAITFRSYYLNRSSSSGGTVGTMSLVDSVLTWSRAAPPASGAVSPAKAAAVAVPVSVGGAAAAALALVLWRRWVSARGEGRVGCRRPLVGL